MNNGLALAEYDNDVLLVSATGRTGISSARLSSDVPVTPLAVVSALLLRRFDYVMFHSGFWPKFWLVGLFAVAIRCRPVWICWGGELVPSTGIRGNVLLFVKKLTMPRFHRAVFLSEGDLQSAANLCGRLINGTVIHYYSAAYCRPADSSRRLIPNPPGVRVQIGNDASAINGHLECMTRLSRVSDSKLTVVYPLGYGRFDPKYIEDLKDASVRLFPNGSAFIDDLLSPDLFDALIESCSTLLLASREQRALYSIFRYLSAGKPVFLPRDASLRQDLTDLGFHVEALEALDTMDSEDFARICSQVNRENIRVGRECLGLDSIKARWAEVLR